MPEIITITEAKAHDVRRRFINQGMAVSLVAYDPARDVYAFDVQMDIYTPRQFGLLYLASRRRAALAEHHDVARWCSRTPSQDAMLRSKVRKLRKFAAGR